ncbi:MAG: ATP-dependent DNA helicase, partial [Deltaproteobacteria bacterium]|nr:ATP-dependent DNA helicase [Deltaproteobacteria bacterium]
LADYKPAQKLKTKAAAAHHAGHLPQFKMLVEELMTRNLISAIFATSTVAAGVNFPARTVVIPQSDRFNGHSFEDLTATDLFQMTGRAGRRGLDNIGFAIVVPGEHMDLALMKLLFRSAPNPVVSSLTINFFMVLNLLNAFAPGQVRDLLSSSLAAWQRAKSHAKKSLFKAAREMWLDFQRHVRLLVEAGLLDEAGNLTSDGHTAKHLRLDHPLALHAAMKNGGLPLEPALLAATLASMSEEKAAPRRYGIKPRVKYNLRPLLPALINLAEAVEPMATLLAANDFPVPSLMNLKNAAAVHCWASGREYNEAVEVLERDPGDLVRLVLTVCEQLNQLTYLHDVEPLAKAAKEARALLLREPML